MVVRRPVAVTMMGLTTGMLVACGNAEVAITGDDPRILVDKRNPDEIVVQPITGRYSLRYDSDTNCLYLENGGLPPAWNVIWPDGTRPVAGDQSRGVEVPGAGQFMEGEVVVVTRATIELATREERERDGEGLGIEGAEEAWDSCGPGRSLMFVYTIERYEE